jgi:hypothetical protein
VTTFDRTEPLCESSRVIKGRSRVGVSVERTSRGYKPRVDLPILSSSRPTTHHQINMSSITPSAPTQSSEAPTPVTEDAAPVTEAGTVPDATRDDTKIFVGTTHVNPPYSNSSYEITDGFQPSFYGTPAAQAAFLANREAVATAEYMISNAYDENDKFFRQQRMGGGMIYFADQIEEWQTRAGELDATIAARVDKHNLPKDSDTIMEVVKNPTKEWKASCGVSEVPLSRISEVAAENRDRARMSSDSHFLYPDRSLM